LRRGEGRPPGLPSMVTGTAVALLLTALQMEPPAGLAEAASAAKQSLHAKHPGEAARIDRGVDQAARYWRASDGDAAAFQAFAAAEFLPGGADLDATFARLEHVLERVGGYLT